MLNQYDLIGTAPGYTAENICHAAARMIGVITWGQLLSFNQLQSALMQLDGLLRDGKNPEETGNLMLALAQRIAPEFDKVPMSPEILEPKWYGDKPEDIQRARAVISSWPVGTSPAQTDILMNQAATFLHGEQWDAEIVRDRDEKQRPTLVINLIPRLVDVAIHREIEAGGEMLTREERVRLQTILTLRNMDAQKMYNYMVSARTEMVQNQLDFMKRYYVRLADATVKVAEKEKPPS